MSRPSTLPTFMNISDGLGDRETHFGANQSRPKRTVSFFFQHFGVDPSFSQKKTCEWSTCRNFLDFFKDSYAPARNWWISPGSNWSPSKWRALNSPIALTRRVCHPLQSPGVSRHLGCHKDKPDFLSAPGVFAQLFLTNPQLLTVDSSNLID